MNRGLVFAITLSSYSMIAFTVFGFSCQAKAASIILGSTSGEWVNPIPDSQNTYCSDISSSQCFVQGVGTNSFSWGEPANNQPSKQPNQLTFIGNSFSASTDINSWFKIGTLTYFNGIIYADTNIGSVTLNLNLSFGEQNPVSELLPVSFNLINTPNINTENIKDPENADYVEVETTSSTNFTLNNKSYLFEIAGFNISAIEGEYSNESGNNIYARFITPPPQPDNILPTRNVPEAPTIAGSFLAGIYLVYRKTFCKLKAKSLSR